MVKSVRYGLQKTTVEKDVSARIQDRGLSLENQLIKNKGEYITLIVSEDKQNMDF
jgi:hypothetical protein